MESSDRIDYLDLAGAIKNIMDDVHEREMKKLFKPIDKNLDFNDCLSRLSTDELADVRRCWDFRGISHLNKAELVEKLKELIGKNLEKWLQLLDSNQIELLDEIIKNDGLMECENFPLETIRYYRKRGILFSGTYDDTRVLVMPRELQTMISNLLVKDLITSRIKKNDKILTFVKGMLIYYGGITLGQLFKQIKEHLPGLKITDYYTLMEEFLAYNLYGIAMRPKTTFIHLDMMDPDYLFQEQQMRDNIDYFPLDDEMIKFAARHGLPKLNFVQRNFGRFLQKEYNLSPLLIDEIIHTCIVNINRGERFQNHFDYLQQFIEFQDIEEARRMGKQLQEFHNNTRLWILKGYTPAELSAREIRNLRSLTDKDEKVRKYEHRKDGSVVRKNKVGRNDPCPCGSGKKYKYCCGR